VSAELNEEASVDLKKREFMDKMGKYAIVGAGMATLMSPAESSANNYGRGGGKRDRDRNHGRENDRDRGRD